MNNPTPFGKYELLERIATGGMAEVFLARSFGAAGFEKHLVIKRIRPEYDRNPRFVQMFINEAKIGVHLNHPNVVQVYELGKVAGTYYIAMEHLHGRDLTRLVKTLRADGERLPLDLAVWVVAEVCRGLAYAHGLSDANGQLLGLVHRDISPHNILVTYTGEVKVVDFGIARVIHTAQGDGDGPPGGGKYAYMSPEQAAGEDVDHRTDIFSTGILLWELIVGHRLFQHPDPEEKLRRVREAIVPHPREEGIEIDDTLWEILRKSLARDRDDRYASGAILEEDLRAWLFETRSRAGRADLSELMKSVFPDDATRSADQLDLRRMASDIEKLDPADRGTGTPSLRTPSGTLPGRLRPSVGERKLVSAVMIDVDGLTQLSAEVLPEVLFKRHYQLLRWFRKTIDRYNGVIQRAIDDQILMFFGVPRTQPDDLDRAIACSLEIQRRHEELTEILGTPVHLAIGIHTGEVTVGMKGHRVRYDARGDTTRLARRLSAVADHDDVLVSERVLQTVGGAFRIHKGPAVGSRGGKPPLPSYRIEGRRTGIRVGGRGPWLRRGGEISVIKNALVTLGRGEGSRICLAGGLGTGKSRLLREIAGLARRRGLPMYVGACTPFGATESPARDLLRGVLALEPSAPTSERDAKIERLTQLGLERRDRDALAALLGARVDPPPSPAEVWMALQRAVSGLSLEGPLIIAIDDVHYLKRREQLAMARMFTEIDGPVLFLLTRRSDVAPELAATWTEEELGAFSADGQRRLLLSLLEATLVDEALVDLVDRTCEGNPLYVEEMVKFLIQRGWVEVSDGQARLVHEPGPDTVPPNLAGLVSARIDALDPASKGILQLAAIVGPSFSTRIVAEAAGVDDPTPLIADLSHNGLIVRGSEPDTWTFASDLVREAALRGSLGVQRRDYHRLVAAAIEKLHAAALDEWFEPLAAHCAEGGRLLDAARFAFKAGEAWEERQYLERARDCYAAGLGYIERAGNDPDEWDMRIQGEASLQLRLGVVGLLLGESSGEAHLQLALDIASDAGLPWIEVRGHLELGKSYLQRGKFTLANAHLQQASLLVRHEDDPELELETVEARADLAFELGKNDEAEALWQTALTLAEGDPRAVARCQLGLANRYLRMGHHDRATPLLDAALAASRDVEDRILQGRVLNNLGLVHSYAGRLDEALASFREALEVRTGIGYTRGVVINHHNIGDVHFSRGDWGRAFAAFQRSRELAAAMGWERGELLNDVFLGYLEATRSDESRPGVDRLRSATSRAEEIGDMEIAASGHGLMARWLAETGATQAATAAVEQGLELARQYGLGAMEEMLEDLATGLRPPG